MSSFRWTKPEYTVDELQSGIEGYFQECVNSGITVTDRSGVPKVVGKKYPTPPGLALHLGYASFQQMMGDFPPSKPGHRQTIRQAISMIEDGLLQRLQDGDVKAQGPIFILKQLGYKDEQRVVIDDTPKTQISATGFNIAIRLVSPAKQEPELPSDRNLLTQEPSEGLKLSEDIKKQTSLQNEAEWVDIGD